MTKNPGINIPILRLFAFFVIDLIENAIRDLSSSAEIFSHEAALASNSSGFSRYAVTRLLNSTTLYASN